MRAVSDNSNNNGNNKPTTKPKAAKESEKSNSDSKLGARFKSPAEFYCQPVWQRSKKGHATWRKAVAGTPKEIKSKKRKIVLPMIVTPYLLPLQLYPIIV